MLSDAPVIELKGQDMIKHEKMPKAKDLGEANRMIQVLWCNVHEQYVGKRISQILAAVLAIAAILPWFF
jgi:hypothetical protein